MALFYYLEILNAQGDVQGRERFTQLPIRVGRSYRNDAIVDDPYMAPEHAQIERTEQGDLCLRDHGSKNGIVVAGKHGVQLQITGDDIFCLGKTSLRLRTSDYAVAPELTQSHRPRRHAWLGFCVALLLIAGLPFYHSWLQDMDNRQASEYAMDAIKWFGFATLWAGIWAIANRTFGGAAHFMRHVVIFSVGLLALNLAVQLCNLLAFGFSWEFFTRYNSHLEIALVATVVFAHLTSIAPRQRKRIKLICVALALTASGFMLMSNHQQTNHYADQLYMSDLLPPVWRFTRDVSVAEFEADISALQASIDAERAKAAAEKAKR